MDKSQVTARLLRTFLAELDEQTSALNAASLALEAEPSDRERLRAVFRVAHTLKGAARAAGVPLVESVCHELETLLVEARDRGLELTKRHFQQLFATADALGDAATRLRRGEPLSGSPLEMLGSSLAAGAWHSDGAPRTGGAVPVAAVGTEGQLRVPALKLDLLLSAGSELILGQGRLALRGAELERLRESALQLFATWRRTGRRIRIELDRAQATTAADDLARIDAGLRQLVRELSELAARAGEDTRELGKAASELQRRVRELRMRPFAEACEALPRAVRDLAAAAGKEVELRISGGEVEADRAVLDGLRDALMQLVRNAVDHGIEAPGARRSAGKPARGSVHVSAGLRGDRIVVAVSDDGSGLDAKAIREALRMRGQAVPESDRGLAQALLEAGLTTRERAGTVSGRGVGLDIVRESVRRIRGTLDVSWEPGLGTRFVIECPPSLVSIRAVLVTAGSQTLAIPTTHVERLLRVRAADIQLVEGRQVVTADTGPLPLISLASLLGWPVAEARAPLPVVLMRTGSRRIAAAVDDLSGESEVMLRPIRITGRGGTLLAGGALLATGQVALVTDPDAIVSTALSGATHPPVALAEEQAAVSARHRILVVDDSITTRTLEQSILEAAGYEVLTAADGSDAWRALQEKGCDLVVADIEMPRMDGFELCQAIRGSKRYARLPVVLVTAMESAEHRARGLEVGADAYIGKSSFDQEHLLETIRQLIGES